MVDGDGRDVCLVRNVGGRSAEDFLAEFRDRMEGAWLGQSIGVVPVRPPRPSALADSRNPGPVPADAKLTEEEMRKILFLPSEKEGKPSVRKMH